MNIVGKRLHEAMVLEFCLVLSEMKFLKAPVLFSKINVRERLFSLVFYIRKKIEGLLVTK